MEDAAIRSAESKGTARLPVAQSGPLRAPDFGREYRQMKIVAASAVNSRCSHAGVENW